MVIPDRIFSAGTLLVLGPEFPVAPVTPVGPKIPETPVGPVGPEFCLLGFEPAKPLEEKFNGGFRDLAISEIWVPRLTNDVVFKVGKEP